MVVAHLFGIIGFFLPRKIILLSGFPPFKARQAEDAQHWSFSSWRPTCQFYSQLDGGNSNIFYFQPYLGKWSNLTNIFQMGWFNHQIDKNGLVVFFSFCLFVQVIFIFYHCDSSPFSAMGFITTKKTPPFRRNICWFLSKHQTFANR